MSVKMMGLVWDADLSRSKKLILLAYADHADHDGTHIYPGIDRIAWKTGYEERQVRRITALLVADGVLVPDGISNFGTNEYHIDVSKLHLRPPYVPPRTGGNPGGTPREDKMSTGHSVNGPDILTNPPDIAMSAQPSVDSSTESSVVTPKPKTAYVKNMEHLEQVFANARGCLPPNWDTDPKAANKRWRMPLNQIFKRCDGDLERAATIVRSVTMRMVQDGLTFDAPDQILKSAFSYIIDTQAGTTSASPSNRPRKVYR